MEEYIKVNRAWLEGLVRRAKYASEYNEQHPGGNYSALIGFASSAETLLKMNTEHLTEEQLIEREKVSSEPVTKDSTIL